MAKKIRVGILEDHQSVIDGYLYRLDQHPDIEVAAIASYGEELNGLVEGRDIDLLLLDVGVPTSPDNLNSYPILHDIPQLLQKHPDLSILVVTMHNLRPMIKAVMDAGASGYILKDDRQSLVRLGEIVASVVDGGVYFSQESYKLISDQKGEEVILLTPRQQEVLSLCASYPSMRTSEIAEKLHVAPSTVRNLLSNTYVRLGVPNRQAAVSKARRLGLIASDASSPAVGS